MSLALRPGLSWCICAGQAAFLDLPRDRYLCLPEALDRAFQRWVAGAEIPPAEQDALVQAGILEPGDAARAPAVALAPPRYDLAGAGGGSPRLVDTLAAIIGQLLAMRWLRHHSIADIVALLGCERPRSMAWTKGDGYGERRLQHIARAFAGSAALLRSADQCLARAIAARRLCRRHGLEVVLVFGVRLAPFAAHSWVQAGDAVIVGDYERVRLYTPILVLP